MLAAAPVAAKPLGTFGKWSAHVLTEGKAKTCYVHGEPTRMKGKYKSRNPTFLQVTHRPAESSRNQIGVTAGYTYRKESEVQVVIDGRKFVLFTDRDAAWTPNAVSDRVMVRAMMKGRGMIVRGTSSRGTKTTDTYSLIGFTKAYRAIGKACKVR